MDFCFYTLFVIYIEPSDQLVLLTFYTKDTLIIAAAKRSVRFAVLKNVRVCAFEDILKNGRNVLISVSLVLRPALFLQLFRISS